MKTKIAALICACAVFTGCATLQQGVERHEQLLRAVVTIATIRVLDRVPQYIPRVFVIATEARRSLLDENDVLEPLAVVESRIRSLIRWDRLDTSEQTIIELLIMSVRGELEQFFARRDIKLPGKARVYVTQVLEWIADAAYVRCDSC